MEITAQESESNMPSTAWAYYPSNAYQSGDVWFDPSYYNNPLQGTYAWHTVMHELGHSIGLKHGHDNSGYGALDAAHDQMSYSVMTYKSHSSSFGSSYSITGQMSINGQGQGAPASNRVFSTIWDAGGVDTIDLSNYHQGTSGDISPGSYLSFSTIQKAQVASGIWADGNVYFALSPENSQKKAYIENLITGAGDDFIFGNKSHNEITTMGGLDKVHGRGGHDKISGNGGKDFLIGGPGADTLDGGLGADTLKGGSGADVFILKNGSGKDIIKDFVKGVDFIDVPDTNLATLTSSNTGHLTVDYNGNWSVLRGLTYDPTLDPLDYVN